MSACSLCCLCSKDLSVCLCLLPDNSDVSLMKFRRLCLTNNKQNMQQANEWKGTVLCGQIRPRQTVMFTSCVHREKRERQISMCMLWTWVWSQTRRQVDVMLRRNRKTLTMFFSFSPDIRIERFLSFFFFLHQALACYVSEVLSLLSSSFHPLFLSSQNRSTK